MARILVVDDERDVATMLKFMLEKDGHVVELAHDGRQALAALGVEPLDAGKAMPGLVILDVMMPDMDGHAVRQRLSGAPHARRVPVLMLTAKGDGRHGAPSPVALLDKPFDPRELRELVTILLGEAR
jgi:DNA-binding response OmpR family regulator